MSAVGGITCYKVQQKQGAAYRAALTIGHGSKGPRRKTVTRKTKDEALKAIYALRADFDRGILKSRGKTAVHDLAMTYFFEVAKERVTEKTLSGYVYNFERYVSPYLGGQRIDHLGAQEVTLWMNQLRKKGLSKTTINGARRSLVGVLDYAVNQELIFSNAAKRAPALRRTKDDETNVKDPLDHSEAMQHLSASRGTDFDLFMHLVLILGLRRGEALGLRWSDIDLDSGLISINGSLSEVPSAERGGSSKISLKRTTPKTKSGIRTLALSTPLSASLMRHKELSETKAQQHGFSPPDYLFFSNRGSPVYPSNFSARFRKWVKAQDLREIRIHDYRHSAATIAINHGIEGIRVQDGLGHSRLETTKNIYASKVKQPALLFAREMGALFVDENEEFGMSLVSKDQIIDRD